MTQLKMSEKLSHLIKTQWYWLIMIGITICYLGGLFTVIYGVDAKIYASIGKEIAETNVWTEIYLDGRDYLDKPPLHFWLIAASYKLFGYGSFAYKFPSFLFTLLGVLSTYRLGQLLYSKPIGQLASLVYYSSFAIILSNQDVRTDSILTNAIIFAIWQLVAFLRNKKWYFFIGGFIGIGLAMLSKGPIGLMIPAMAIGTELIIKRQWKQLFHPIWLLGLCITFLTISPMLYGLYTQFDAQPEKVFQLSSGMEVSHYSGLRFYLWDQSFGRIFGGNKEEWNNNLSIFFFTHTYLWSFLPWALIGLVGLFKKIKLNLSSPKTEEWFTLGAIIFPFIAISLSSYKLPHYINPIIPFLSILTARTLLELSSHSIWIKIQKGIGIILLIAIILIITYITPISFNLTSIIITLLIIAFISSYWISSMPLKAIYHYSLSIMLIGFVINFQLIPSLTAYHSPYQAAQIANKNAVETIYSRDIIKSLSFDLYFDGSSEDLKNISPPFHQKAIYIKEEHLNEIMANYPIDTIYHFEDKELNKVSLPFLNPNTRADQTEKYCLVILNDSTDN